jgi:acyl dehydratase
VAAGVRGSSRLDGQEGVMVLRELDESPRLGRLYRRAAVGGLRRNRAEALPDTEFALAGVRVDGEAVAAYARVCGLRRTDELPVTYPHLLGFPLQAKLMTEPDFPFPMIGLVHVANRISWTRPLRADEPLVVRVNAANLRPHERGTQVDLCATVSADGEPVWTSVSTYLRRGKGSGGTRRSTADGPVEPPVAVWRVPADTGRRYAAVSGDANPIHLHPVTARLFGFPRAIAHGMWSAARCLAFFEGRVPAAGTLEVSFRAPILLPGRVELRGDAAEFRLSGQRTHLVGRLSAD